MATPKPSLSIIIPTLNEADHMPQLLQDLVRQQHITFEIIIVDGGSRDATMQYCETFAREAGQNKPAIKLFSVTPGRGRQMNYGVQQCSSDDYLFLHADTRIKDSQLLWNAQRAITHARTQAGQQRIAGHFPLRFTGQQDRDKRYYFYESKSHLNRPDCINGDQGFWIAKSYFHALGQFDESLPYMEDARLALKIFATGQWITLPGEIETSSRRFETEGFARRQILNSFLCNFNAMGASRFFQSALDAYKAQPQTTSLRLRPFLKLAHQQMHGDGLKCALKRWYQTGAYIAANSWQLAFALDCKRNKQRGLDPGLHGIPALEFYDRHIAPIANRPIVKVLTAFVTIIWFYSLFLIP